MKSSERIALSLVGVLAIGALAGILFAPAKGKITRERIGRKGKRLVSSIDDVIQESRGSLGEARDELLDKLENLKEKSGLPSNY